MDVESFERHCRTCAVCAESLARDEQLRALGRALTGAQPGQLALKRLRARVLRDVTTSVPTPPVSWQRVTLAASLGMVLVGIASLVAVRTASRADVRVATSAVATPSGGPLAGAVVAVEGAVWSQSRADRVERVELEAGTVQVHVRTQGPGERFFVGLPDGEIEVRGTTFDVTTRDGTTRQVSVHDGTVVLRLRGAPELRLGPQMSWAPPESAPPSVPKEVTAPASASAAMSSRRAAADARKEGDDGWAYIDAMRSFQAGSYDRAAAAFHAFALDHPRAPEGEDASFLEAVSLARAGRADAAALAAERHLESFPRSFRRKEASILVARAASHRGNCEEALRVLAPWMSVGSDADIQSALRACSDSGSTRP